MRGPSVRAVAVLVFAVFVIAGCGSLRRGGSEDQPAPIDLNHASVRAIEQLPGITPSMAARIVAGRPYPDAEALVERNILTPREFERIADRVVVRTDTSRR